MKELKFTKSSFKQFKKLYKKAVKNNMEIFTFQEHIIVTNYAKYLIEYIENVK